MLEHESHAARRAQRTAALVEIHAHAGHRAVGVVRGGLHQESDAVRAVSLIDHLLVVGRILRDGAFDRPLDILLGHVLGLGVLDQNTQADVGRRIGAAGLDGDFDLLADFGKSAGHVAPPFQFARLAVLKCSSHDSYLFVIIFNSGAKLRHFTEKGKKSPAKNDRLPAAARSQGSLPTKTGAHARPDRTRMQPRIGPASPAARRRMSGKRPSGVTSIAARRPARASTPRPRRAGKAARCPTRKASAAGRCPLPIRARLFVQTTVD